MWTADLKLYRMPRGWHRRAMASAMLGVLLLLGSGLVWAQPGNRIEDAYLQPFTSSEDLGRYLKEGLLAESKRASVLPSGGSGSVMSIAAAYPDPAISLTTADTDQKPTLLADTVASDGRYLYVIPDSEIELTYDQAADLEPEDGKDARADTAVRVLEVMDNSPEAFQIGKIGFAQHRVPLSGLYLFEEAGKEGENLLVTVGNRAKEAVYFWSNPLDWRGKITEVVIYDVSAPEDPRPMARLVIDGQLVSTRRIGSRIHLVTRFSPAPPGYLSQSAVPGAAEVNQEAIENAPIEDLSPGYRINAGPRLSLADPETCLKTPTIEGATGHSSQVTITTIDVSDPESPISQTVVGFIEALHMAEDTLYVASVRSDSRPSGDDFSIGMQDPSATIPAPVFTDIHKFDLTEEGPVYRGSGTVEGRLGRNADERPFWIDAYHNVLRVVTFLKAEGDEPGYLRLTLLKEAPFSEGLFSLAEISRLNNLGTLARDRFRIQFAGRFAYLSGQTPAATLRLIDLSDPERPLVGGELPDTGTIDRLFAVGNGFLIGIGKQAAPEDTEGTEIDQAPRHEGLTLLLVNAQNPATPVVVDFIDIGKQGTQSEACSQPQALYAAPLEDGLSMRLALPIELYDAFGRRTDSTRPHTDLTFDWIHTGLYLFEVYFETTTGSGRRPGFEAPDVIISDQAADGQTAYWTLNRGTDRVLVLGSAVYYVHRGNVWSALLERPAEVIGPR